jgi:hypothetical protein
VCRTNQGQQNEGDFHTVGVFRLASI